MIKYNTVIAHYLIVRYLRFLTTKQIESLVRDKFSEAERRLQMPPVMKQLEENQKVISVDPAIKGFDKDDSAFVFTDVTYGLKDAERSVVIRHSDGLLENASYDIRKRVCQIYFPLNRRKFREPKMFESENVKRLIGEFQYEFLLDSLCLQYEPFERKFHEISSQIYQHINEHQLFDKLRSTRHFGPLAFFLAWHKMIDDLLLDMIRNDYLKNGVELICLMYQLNGIEEPTNILKNLEFDNTERQIKATIDGLLSQQDAPIKKFDKTKDDLKIDEICFEFIIDSFVKNHALKKPQLELALQSYKEIHNELKSLNEASGSN